MGRKTAVAQGPRHGLQQASRSRAELPPQPDGAALALRGVEEVWGRLPNVRFRLIPDANRWNKLALLRALFGIFQLVWRERPDVVITTGGTGFSGRDVTPEATLAVAHKEMPGFGEQMRQISLAFVPTAILSRQVAVIRDKSLIINLPGQPKAIAETLEGLKNADGTQKVNGIFAAVPYCIDLIGGPYLETHDDVCKAFRPKSAVRPAR